jgi:tRNA U54 and U55 pseudouridine synthase Pus10
VPQSPWSLAPPPSFAPSTNTTLSGSSSSSSGAPEAKKARIETPSAPSSTAVEEPTETTDEDRKGRPSVEEILASYVNNEIGCFSCHLHACGREDIDVRCLGNGRPFVLEILQAKKRITNAWLTRLQQMVNSRQGMNIQGDISIYHTQLVSL